MRSPLFAIALVLAGCTRVPVEPDKPAASNNGAIVNVVGGSASVTVSSAAPTAPAVTNAGAAALPHDMAWDAPASWTAAANASAMRKATYKIGKVAPDTDDAEMSVLVASGGVQANVARWEGQFGGAKAKTDARTIGGLKVTVVEIRGSFAGGMPGAPGSGPKEKQVLLGAIVDTEPQHFFKLTGGEKTVDKAKPEFEKLVASFRAK